MKQILLTLLGVFMFAASTPAMATVGFPVERTTITTTNDLNEEISVEITTSPAATLAAKDKWVAAALWFVLGGLAAHRWYLGSPWYWNVLFIITLGGLVVWAIVDIVNILTDNWDGL